MTIKRQPEKLVGARMLRTITLDATGSEFASIKRGLQRQLATDFADELVEMLIEIRDFERSEPENPF